MSQYYYSIVIIIVGKNDIIVVYIYWYICIYISLSHPLGHYSWRNTTNGSWFVQSLVHVLGREASHDDLLSIMTSVNRYMINNFESNCPCK